MISDRVALALVAAAKANQIEPAALLAIAEVETGGKLFEQDGRTPALLYERHVAYRQAAKRNPTLLQRFTSAGLAIPKWSPPAQYQDERTSAQRLELIERARTIDGEVANNSASWGVGQTMGFLHQDLGFANATDMVDFMTGSLDGQIECMIREIRKSHLIEPLNEHDWPHVARIYNGSGYAKNSYDVKLADAYKRWLRKIDTIAPGGAPREVPPEQQLSHDDVLQVQRRLRDLGYVEVGEPDGTWGSRTVGALAAFQSHEGLKVTSHYDDATRSALIAAAARAPSRGRELTTVQDLREEGSKTIEHADNVGWWGRLKVWLGGSAVAGGAAGQAGVFDQANDAADKISQARSAWSSVSDVVMPSFNWLFGHGEIIVFGLVLIVGGVAVMQLAGAIKRRRLADHQSGVHAGAE